jgi:hypothetical protein
MKRLFGLLILAIAQLWSCAASATYLYGIEPNGDLIFYKYTGFETGDPIWPLAGKKIGTGWRRSDIKQVFGGGDGAFYMILTNGDLLYYKFAGFELGDFNWPLQGKKIGNGWNSSSIKRVFAGSDGAVFVITTNGDLRLYKFAGSELGDFNWPIQSVKIGNGWTDSNIKGVFPGPWGSIYIIETNGNLLFYKFAGFETGAVSWPVQAKKVGVGWAGAKQVFVGSDNTIYAIQPDGRLLFYKHSAFEDGTVKWPIQSKVIGSGWNQFTQVLSGE